MSTQETDDAPSDSYELGPEQARRERVSPQLSLIGKQPREQWEMGMSPIALETNEYLPEHHLELLRRFKRDRHILLLASDDLPEEVKQAVDQAERYLAARLRDLDYDIEPHRMTSETDTTARFL